jgi:RNA polymerase sigma-70 factor (ECF subfamily)
VSSPARESPPDGTPAATPDERLGELMANHQVSLYNFLVVVGGDRQVARDCLQDTFLRAYEQLCRGKPVNVQWLYRVARNRAMDHFRERQRVRQEPLADHEGMEVEMPTMGRDASVRRALAALAPADRELLYLAHVDRFRAREIADMMGTREGAVRMRLSRAHRRFRAVYEGEP